MIPAPSFLASLANAAARSLLLAGVVSAGLLILRVRNVVAQKAAWILVLLASLAMPAVAPWAAQLPWLPDQDTFVLPSSMWSNAGVRNSAPLSVTAKANAIREPDPATQPPIATEPEPAPSAQVSRFPAPTIAQRMDDNAPAAPTPIPTPLSQQVRAPLAWLTMARGLLLLYLAVAGVLLLRLCLGAWAALKLWRRAKPAQLALPAGIRVRSSRAVASPVTLAQGIVLPFDYTGWDTEKLRIVLAHEGSHVRQRDFLLQLAASLHIALFWFNPLAWWLKRKLSRLSETISDGAAVHQAASHASYAQVLLEFAALPRPIPIGVAMAHRGHLRSRIEHLLNENSFRQAFSGGRMRLAAAVLLVPIALFAATAMVRVDAAAQQAPPAQAVPAPAPSPASPANPPASGSTVVPAGAPSDSTTPPPPYGAAPGPASDGDLVVAPPQLPNVLVLPDSQAYVADAKARALVQAQIDKAMSLNVDAKTRLLVQAQIAKAMAINADPKSRALLQAQIAKAMAFNKENFFRDGFAFWNDGNSYAYVTGEGEKNVHFSGNWLDGSQAEIDKARKVAHGDFLWFERDGKSYVIDDPAVLAALKPMQQQVDELGKQQEVLGKQQKDLGQQQEALGRQMEQLRVPTPDMKKELAKLQAASAKLAALQGKDASEQQLSEIQGELAEIQGEIGSLQGEMGGHMGDLGGKQGELGAQQGKLGAEQGRLGAQQGRIAREMDGKVLTIIDESLKDGKARPMQ